jgi:hypothetical protein
LTNCLCNWIGDFLCGLEGGGDRIVDLEKIVAAHCPSSSVSGTLLMYLDWRGQWRLRPLSGIASAPLLQDDGRICSTEGYDAASGMWCENMPDLAGLVPDQPTEKDAKAGLRLIRDTFKTFCFADADMIGDAVSDVAVLDIARPPACDESSFLIALLTAVCRPSLPLAPAVLLRAAPMSGAGAGKGLLARCISIIAFGREPHAVTGGSSSEELDKRIAAELMEGGPVLFLDNLNNTAVKSDLLASTITERPTRVRLLGKSQMVRLNSSAFVILTGNGLTVAEDLARRFIIVELDPRTEDPEARPFTTNGGIGPAARIFRCCRHRLVPAIIDPHRPFAGVRFLAGRGGWESEAKSFFADVEIPRDRIR